MDEYEDTRDLNPPRDKWVLYCKDFYTAARYAADQDWWLHSWKHLTDDYAPDSVVVYERKDDNDSVG
jgi:hypothetical protein